MLFSVQRNARLLAGSFAFLCLFSGYSSSPASAHPSAAAAQPASSPPRRPTSPRVMQPQYRVMLGIDVLEANRFAALQGKRVGLLTHPAGVDRRGVSSIDVLRRAPGAKLVALYAVEHGIYNELVADKPFPDQVDPRTGLMVYSLFNGGKSHKPTPTQLAPIDVLVVDLQDIGTRSYTFVSAMKVAMEACFENGKEIIVLDRPNPLGGLKVDGPIPDPQWQTNNYLSAFPVPYVHGLTIGELARMAKSSPGVLSVTDAVRSRGKLTVIPMTGWRRAMRWTDTGLSFVPTSTRIQNPVACEGYPMTGLGCFLGGFSHGIGENYPFRALSHNRAKLETVEAQLRTVRLPGLEFHPVKALNRSGKPVSALYLDITDYNAWRPVELNFWLMKLACMVEPQNPFSSAPPTEQKLFLQHMGSSGFFNDLVSKGARVDVAAWVRRWRAENATFQQQSRRFWLYN